jgi:hypothetical protein
MLDQIKARQISPWAGLEDLIREQKA